IEVNLAATSTMVSGDTTQVNYNNGASGAVTRSLRDKLREIVSVKDFGAVLDGVTDDRNALVRAANAASGGTIVLPKGTLYLSSAVDVGGARLVGDNTTIAGEIRNHGGLQGVVINGFRQDFFNNY